MSEGNNINHVAKKARHSDHVLLNVGGTKFSTSITTLTSSSAYFQSLFSEEWADSRGSGDGDEVFVDQDPGPFRALLSYMRLGKIEASELTLPVLLQAQYFGMERLLAAARGVARRSADDSELAKKCRAAGITPRDEEKEIVSLTLVINEIAFEGQENLRLWEGREIVAHIDGLKKDDGTKRRVFTTFVDGLNWLHRNGFTKHEAGIEKEFDDVDYHVLGVLYFSRIATDNESRDELESIIIGSGMCTRENKEFAACITIPNPTHYRVLECWIEVDIGKEKDKNRRRIENIDEVETKMSRITRLPGDRFKVEPSKFPGWLQANSFFKREKELEDVYRKALSSEELSFLDEKDHKSRPSILSLWSRESEC